MPSSLKIAFAAFLVTAAAIKAVPALAAPVQPVENVAVVHTADLDLSTDAGRHQLDRRLVIAAAEVCGSASDADLAGQNALRLCRKDVLAKVGQHRGDQAERVDFFGSDADDPAHLPRVRGCAISEELRGSLDLLRSSKQIFAGRRESVARLPFLEERKAERPLERGDPARDRRLADL